MWQSLLLKLGMFAATMGVVFWIGWTLPTSFDHARDRAAESSEGPTAEIVSGNGRVTTVSPSPVALLSASPSAAAPKRSHKGYRADRANGPVLTLCRDRPRFAERIREYRNRWEPFTLWLIAPGKGWKQEFERFVWYGDAGYGPHSGEEGDMSELSVKST